MLETFRQLYGAAEGARIYRAPGRVNLIGEHTDYPLGFVLPVALDLATHVAAVPSPDGMLRIYSQQRGELREFTAAAIPQSQPAHHWTDYPIGVAVELARAGVPPAPATPPSWPASASAPSAISSACPAASWISTSRSSAASTPPSKSIAAAWATASSPCPKASPSRPSTAWSSTLWPARPTRTASPNVRPPPIRSVNPSAIFRLRSSNRSEE